MADLGSAIAWLEYIGFFSFLFSLAVFVGVYYTITYAFSKRLSLGRREKAIAAFLSLGTASIVLVFGGKTLAILATYAAFAFFILLLAFILLSLLSGFFGEKPIK